MEGDDEPDRPLGEQDALWHANSFRTNETFIVLFSPSWGSAVNLANEAWSHGSAEDAWMYRRNILANLVDNGAIQSVDLGYHFLTSTDPTLPDEGDSTNHLRTTLRAIGNLPSLGSFKVVGLPGSPATMNTRVLLESMATFQNDLVSLELAHIEIRTSSEVQLLADLLRTRGGTLTKLSLKGLVPVINDDMAGFLDPILLAIKSSTRASCLLQPLCIELSGSDGVSVSGVSLISEAALGRFLSCDNFTLDAGNKRALYLKGLGLGDSHVKLIAELLPTVNTRTLQGASASLSLHLQSNPAIGLPGHEALLGMLNRGSDIGQIRVDDAGWTATFRMVADMNTKYGRGEFMEGGVFPDKVTWMDWVKRLVNATPAEEMEEDEDEVEVEEGLEVEEDQEEDEEEDFETRKLNYIWYTLLQKPDFISN
jgi:hypothetical protein